MKWHSKYNLISFLKIEDAKYGILEFTFLKMQNSWISRFKSVKGVWRGGKDVLLNIQYWLINLNRIDCCFGSVLVIYMTNIDLVYICQFHSVDFYVCVFSEQKC